MTTLPFNSQPTGQLAVSLRHYQADAVAAIYRWFETNRGNPLIVVPTGGGKSVIISAFVHSVLAQWPTERIVCVTHVKELIAQNHAALLRAWPSAPAGICSAGLRRREHDAPILFGGIQSIYQDAAKVGWTDLVIVDEAHLIPSAGMGMYRTFLDALRSMNPDLKVIGFTATPFRTGEGSLHKGSDKLFDGIAYSCDIVQLIQDGFLSPILSKGTKAPIDTSGVHVRGGDFVESELQEAAVAGDNVARTVDEIMARGQDRKAWLLFCCGIDHAERVAAELTGRGIACATIFGNTKREERDRIVQDYKAGRIRAVANVGVLTTGFDAPHTDLVVLLRPTLSPVLFVQMVGRGLRIAPGKTNCLVLDFGSNVMRHGPIDCIEIDEPRERDKNAPPPARECPTCQTLIPIQVRQCPECGHEWVVVESEPDVKHAIVPDEDRPLIAGLERRNPIERQPVQSVTYQLSEKPGKPTTLCVSYWVGFRQACREWVCFEHPAGSFPRRKAEQWWKTRGGNAPCPETCDMARVRIELGELLDVTEVIVDTRGEWPEVKGVTVAPHEPGAIDDAPPASDVDYSEIPF